MDAASARPAAAPKAVPALPPGGGVGSRHACRFGGRDRILAEDRLHAARAPAAGLAADRQRLQEESASADGHGGRGCGAWQFRISQKRPGFCPECVVVRPPGAWRAWGQHIHASGPTTSFPGRVASMPSSGQTATLGSGPESLARGISGVHRLRRIFGVRLRAYSGLGPQRPNHVGRVPSRSVRSHRSLPFFRRTQRLSVRPVRRRALCGALV